jgi:hypothetical protein
MSLGSTLGGCPVSPRGLIPLKSLVADAHNLGRFAGGNLLTSLGDVQCRLLSGLLARHSPVVIHLLNVGLRLLDTDPINIIFEYLPLLLKRALLFLHDDGVDAVPASERSPLAAAPPVLSATPPGNYKFA